MAVFACAPEGSATGFTSLPGSSAHTTGTSEGGPSSSSSTGAGGESSSTGSSTSTSGSDSTGPRLDMGVFPDFDAKPPGCQGKIDFLFIISRDDYMKPHQDKLVAAFPHFIETIQSQFEAFDVQIMVTDSDPDWHSAYCENDCPGVCAADPDYPCAYQPTYCDKAIGAGVVMNVGPDTEDTMCLQGPKRYITAETPNLVETFECLARVGASGYNMIGDALVAAMSPQLNQFGACNEGFIRDDALLMVTIIGQEDPVGAPAGSEGTWQEWKQAVVDKKHGNLDAIVMLGLISGDPTCLSTTKSKYRLCRMIPQFPHHVLDLLTTSDYRPFFDEAATLAIEACSAFVPG